MRSAVNNKSLHSMCIFLFGLLFNVEHLLLEFLDILKNEIYCPVNDVPFHKLGHYDVVECHRSHLLLQCIGEMVDLPFSRSMGQTLVQCLPNQIAFSHLFCNDMCLSGFVKICSLIDSFNEFDTETNCVKHLEVVVSADRFVVEFRSILEFN